MAQLVKTVNGLAIASVKTVNGLAIASVKTINGLDNTGGATPWQHVIDASGTSNVPFGRDLASDYQGIAGSFTPAATATVDSITLNVLKNGTGHTTESFTVAIYTDSSGDPGSAITNGSITGNLMSALTTSYADTVYNFATSPTVTASTLYWLVIMADQVSATNYCRTQLEATGSEAMKRWDGSSWISYDVTADIRATLDGFEA